MNMISLSLPMLVPYMLKDTGGKLNRKLRDDQNAHKRPVNYEVLEHSPVSHMLLYIIYMILINKQYIAL